MALATFAELKASIAAWLHRSDLTTVIPDFVALAESDIRKDVRCSAMETYTSGTLSGETLTFPTRFLEARRLVVGGNVHRYVTPEEYAHKDDAGSTSNVFTVIGQNIYILNGANGDAYGLVYWAGLAPFSADADTNFLLTFHPGIYLHGALAHAKKYERDADGVVLHTGQYQAAAARINNEAVKAAVFGPLSVRAAVVE